MFLVKNDEISAVRLSAWPSRDGMVLLQEAEPSDFGFFVLSPLEALNLAKVLTAAANEFKS